jgi:hypothetical protein
MEEFSRDDKNRYADDRYRKKLEKQNEIELENTGYNNRQQWHTGLSFLHFAYWKSHSMSAATLRVGPGIETCSSAHRKDIIFSSICQIKE